MLSCDTIYINRPQLNCYRVLKGNKTVSVQKTNIWWLSYNCVISLRDKREEKPWIFHLISYRHLEREVISVEIYYKCLQNEIIPLTIAFIDYIIYYFRKSIVITPYCKLDSSLPIFDHMNGSLFDEFTN